MGPDGMGGVVRLSNLAKIAFAAMLALHCGDDPASEASKPGRLPLHPSHEVDSARLACPEGTREMGAAPPEGLEQYCAIVAEEGSEVLHGPSRTWYRPGTKESEGAFKNGKLHGLWFVWHADGTADAKGRFVDGKKQGEWRFYEQVGNGKRRHVYVHFKDDIEHGEWKARQVAELGVTPRLYEVEGHYENGKKSGVWVHYDENGYRDEEVEYAHGKRHGPATYWHPFGKKKEEGQYRDGKREGTWTEMEDGVPRYRSGEYVDDKKHGPWREYGADGELLGTLIYASGELASSPEEQTAVSEPPPQ
ncbi:MAG: toxin-antitoxin system YwqK family antitoxin [Deltaproteobacteria bacterium]|nr:toxin-antitoxin system YwqK family antitoxin [Deltaproteobacteria bacterium]